ncbi:hypothetical protein [Bradyrhizobium sp. CB3481]|uniref:hypothetical protein n=1 Tax=Bradyrhizobium sp. CB3481 TaxID=3039158 RepID=UPI0024B089B2|nr:hypothetical protein [Bradyrhizobium sp. CB3481]WFU14427.1 hypothetical protein QA643_24940 [Bradyrhizobium sp. CB3481]
MRRLVPAAIDGLSNLANGQSLATASAENIDFGIKGAMIISFLDCFGIEPQMEREAATIGRAAVVRQPRETIARVACKC